MDPERREEVNQRQLWLVWRWMYICRKGEHYGDIQETMRRGWNWNARIDPIQEIQEVSATFVDLKFLSNAHRSQPESRNKWNSWYIEKRTIMAGHGSVRSSVVLGHVSP